MMCVCILVLQPSFYSAKNNTKNSEVERILLFVATSGYNNKLFISTKSLKFYAYPQKDRYYLKWLNFVFMSSFVCNGWCL